MNEQRYLLVVSGPSGSGKDTVVKRLIEKYPGIELSVSATTRAPRPDEADGEHYHFITKEEFEGHITRGELLEYAQYVGNYYGTLKSEVDKRIGAGITCVLVIEVEGAAQIRALYPDATMVFLLPPSLEELEQRLRKRGTESEEWMQKRLQRAEHEMLLADSYDYRLINENADACADELYAILCRRQAEAAAKE